MKSSIIKSVLRYIEDTGDEIKEFRETLHANPELSLCERSTRDFILSKIPRKEFVCVHKFDDTYGFWVDVAFGGNASASSAAIRADIDALPIQEETGLPFASKNAGVMHACGHDAHAAMAFGALCAAVKHYDVLRENIKTGALRFIFQAAEEKAPGGALALIEKGVMKGVEAIFGIHVMPHIASGRFAICDGGIMAGGERLNVTLTGNGGHAARPEEACDLILLAGEIITSSQKLVSRNTSPLEPAVVSFCEIHAGAAGNILPSSLAFSVSLRSLDPVVLKNIRAGVEKIIKLRCEEYGASFLIEAVKGYPPMINEPGAVGKYLSAARNALGESGVVYPEKPVMGGDDFARYAQIAPGAFAFLGTGAGSETYPLHHPKFNLADSDILNGTKLLAALICEFAG